MFEIVRNSNFEIPDKGNNKYFLLHDGESVDNLNIQISEESPKYKKKFIVEAISQYETQFLINFSLEDFKESLSKLVFVEWLIIDDFIWRAEINISKLYYDDSTYDEVLLLLEPNLELWKNSFSFAEYNDLFTKYYYELNTSYRYGLQAAWGEFLGITIERKYDCKSISLKEFLGEDEKFIRLIHDKTVEKLIENKSDNIIFAVFDFPEKIKFQCEQYLLYFAQFLQDLGINSTLNVKEEAEKVLFSVTPTNKIEALDKIREVLAVYLNLPSSPLVYDDSFAAMRLQQQIENLEHSQKMAVREIQLAEKVIMIQSETIREKNTIISQKDSTIEQQSKIIEKISSKSIMMDSLENKAEFEKVFDGLEFGESKELKEKLGIKFNPLTSLKSLGKKLSGDDEITSLNLNEETDKNN